MPVACDDGVDVAGYVQHGERDHFTPRKRVADAAIERVRAIFGEPDDVRLRLDAGQPSAQTRDARADEHDAEPQGHPRVEAALEQIERQRARRDEEDENPDRPVVEPVVKLVAFANLAVRCVLDGDLGHELLRFFDRVGDRRVYPGHCAGGVWPHIPFLNDCASASARFSSSSRASGTRAVTRASPSRTRTTFAHTSSSVTTYARRRLYVSNRCPSLSSRTQRCSTRLASLSRAAYANGADVSNTRPISGASMPSRRTRPNIVTSMVSP